MVKANPNYRKEIEALRSDLWFILGKAQHMQRNFPGALDCYLRAVQLHEGNMAAQFNLGKVYFHNEAFQQAEPCFEVVVNNPRHKDCYEALRLLAQTKGVLGKTDESVALFKRVLQLCPRDFEANIEIAQNYE